MSGAKPGMVLILVCLLAAGCTDQPSQRLELTSGDPEQPVAIDEGSAREESIELGVDIEWGMDVYRFRAEVAAAVGDLDQQFGHRLIVDSFVPQKTEYVIYVTELAESDRAWLQSVSSGGLGGTVVIEADPSLPRPSGPCLDRSQRARGETTLLASPLASAGSESIEASLGHINVAACPGIGQEVAAELHGDGFFLNLDTAVLFVEAEAVLVLEAIGLRQPRLVTGLAVVADETTSDGHRWEVVAPSTPGSHEVDLRILWAEGDALYRIRLEVN